MNRLATNCDYRTIADKFRVSTSSAIRWTNKVIISLTYSWVSKYKMY